PRLTCVPSYRSHCAPRPATTRSAAFVRELCQLPGTLMYAHPVFGGSAVPSAAGVNCQMPSKETCARFELMAVTEVFSQLRFIPAGNSASANGVSAGRWNVSMRMAVALIEAHGEKLAFTHIVLASSCSV